MHHGGCISLDLTANWSEIVRVLRLLGHLVWTWNLSTSKCISVLKKYISQEWIFFACFEQKVSGIFEHRSSRLASRYLFRSITCSWTLSYSGSQYYSLLAILQQIHCKIFQLSSQIWYLSLLLGLYILSKRHSLLSYKVSQKSEYLF